jgi:putative endopeptidase
MKKFSYLFVIAMAVSSLLAFTYYKQAGSATTVPIKYIDSANFDFKVKPTDNFYLYANGNWLKNNPIPASESRWGSFSEIQEFNYKALRELLDHASKTPAAKGSNTQKIGDFYLSGMDSLAAEKRGYDEIKPDFARVEKIATIDDILNEVAYQHTIGDQPLFYFYADQDAKNSARIVPQVYQGGLSLPDKDYYFKTDERSVSIREKFVTHVEKMFMLIGENENDAKAHAQQIMTLETKLATASMSRVEQRDPEKVYNKLSINDFGKQTPLMVWRTLMSKMYVEGWDTLIVGQPKFFEAVNTELHATPINEWKTYFRWHILNGSASVLSSAFVNENFAFSGKVMSGQKENKPRWKRVLATVDGNLGEILGIEYVNKYFKPEAKVRMLELVNNLQKTYAERIKQLTWMSDPTKQKALQKLNAFIKKIGYPDKWRDYSSIVINKNSYVKNIQSCAAFEYKRNIAKLGKPVDKKEWGMTPPTVNAYYNPGFNEIVFPAGILHFPFFDFGADDAVNYGGIGAVIGHEMTHGFDDQGSQYDAEGNLRMWWTDEDKRKFDTLTNGVVKQFDAYTVLNGTMHVNGKLTVGENIADLGGVSISYAAFKKTTQGKGNAKITGFTPDQRFFLSWAQVWRSNVTDEATALRINTDPHSPGMYRCNGPLTNFKPFYDAFGVKQGDGMWKPESERVLIW